MEMLLSAGTVDSIKTISKNTQMQHLQSSFVRR